MKNKQIKNYAEALAEIALKAEKSGSPSSAKPSSAKITERFLMLLIKLGYQSKARKIVELAEEIILKKKGNKKITLETARRLTAGNRVLLKQFVKEGDVVKEKVNSDLIAGVKVIINNEKQFDNSLKSKLQNIF